MDIVYRCHRCGKLNFSAYMRRGRVLCKKCGSRRFEPAIQDLTKLGFWLCNKWDKHLEKTYAKKHREESR